MIEKITDNSDENTFHQLTSQSATLVMPLFQRRYVWSKRELERMFDEIRSVVEQETASRFLGAVIAVRRVTNPSQPDPYEIVDGQQRLTTLYLILLAAAQLAAKEGRIDYAKGLIGTNLYVDWAQEVPYNTKLAPSIEDRPQFRAIFEEVIKTGDLETALSHRIKLPLGGQEASGPLIRQFKNIKSLLSKSLRDNGFEFVEKLVDAARNGLTFVFILLKDPGSATTVFEGLNDPGKPISVGDLVKNEVFARKGYDAEDAQHLHDTKWTPFFERFGDKFNDYFFPYAVVLKSNSSKTDMFRNLREAWGGLDSGQVIEHLDAYSGPFLALTGNNTELSKHPIKLRRSIENLHRAKNPSSALPFQMRLLNHFGENSISLDETVAILELLEAFFVRRALCGVEPTGLLGMFRTMWSNMDGHPTAEKVANVILNRQTVEWPSDTRLEEQIRERPMYNSSIARFAIFEYDRSFRADQGRFDDFTVEHVLPQALTPYWETKFPKSVHGKVKDLWANLIPLTADMNGSILQDVYENKRSIFQQDSMFASSRDFATRYDDWTPETLETRSRVLFEWASARWPRP